jgi:hypothetical protein
MTIRITPENVTDYPKGTKVEFFHGAYYPRVEGTVVGFKIVPESKWFEEYAELIAEYTDVETNEVVSTGVRMFMDVGIGVYLLEVAEKKINKKSPWAS